MSLAMTGGLGAVPVPYAAANRELQQLAERLQSRVEGRFSWWFFSRPTIDCVHQGFRCRVVGMNQLWAGDTNTSVSCIVELPKQTRARLRMESTALISTNFFADLEPSPAVPRSNLAADALSKVLPDSLQQMLGRLDLPYQLVLHHDRITFTAFCLYEHDFYLRVLDILTEMAKQVLESE